MIVRFFPQFNEWSVCSSNRSYRVSIFNSKYLIELKSIPDSTLSYVCECESLGDALVLLLRDEMNDLLFCG